VSDLEIGEVIEWACDGLSIDATFSWRDRPYVLRLVAEPHVSVGQLCKARERLLRACRLSWAYMEGTGIDDPADAAIAARGSDEMMRRVAELCHDDLVFRGVVVSP